MSNHCHLQSHHLLLPLQRRRIISWKLSVSLQCKFAPIYWNSSLVSKFRTVHFMIPLSLAPVNLLVWARTCHLKSWLQSIAYGWQYILWLMSTIYDQHSKPLVSVVGPDLEPLAANLWYWPNHRPGRTNLLADQAKYFNLNGEVGFAFNQLGIEVYLII